MLDRQEQWAVFWCSLLSPLLYGEIPPQASKPKHNYLDLLIAKHEEALRDRHAGIDYQAVLAAAGRRWPFAEFVKQLATHLGRRGSLKAFTAEELESLQKVRLYQRYWGLIVTR